VTIKEIRDVRDQIPFVPFFLELSSGRMVPVANHDQLMFTSGEDYVVIANESVSIVDPSSIVSIYVAKAGISER